MNEDRIKALKAAGLAGFLAAVEAIPVVGNLMAAGGAAVAAYMDAMEAMKELPEVVQEAVEALEDDYRRMLQRESARYEKDGETILALSLTATITLVTRYGLSAEDLVNEAGLDAGSAAELTLARGETGAGEAV